MKDRVEKQLEHEMKPGACRGISALRAQVLLTELLIEKRGMDA